MGKLREHYVDCAQAFVAYHRRPPQQMGELEIRQFLMYLVETRKVGPATRKMHVAGIKFLYRTWAELLAALGIDALECPKCAARMRVLRLVREAHDIRNKLAAMGEPTAPPARAPARGPPYWASRALRIRADANAA